VDSENETGVEVEPCPTKRRERSSRTWADTRALSVQARSHPLVRARPWAGHPRATAIILPSGSWMAGPSPAKTTLVGWFGPVGYRS